MNISSRTFSWIDQGETYGRHIVEKFLRQCGEYDNVLDIGAGGGTDLSIAKKVNERTRCSAFECYAPYVERLQKMAFDVYSLNLEKDRIPFADETLDVVIANQVLEHTKEIFWIIHEITRTLKVGGHIIIGVPNVAAFHNRIGLLLGMHPSQVKTCSAHVRCFSKHDFMDFLTKTFPDGYNLKDFSGSNFYPFPKKVARTLATMMPTMAQTLFFLLQKTKKYDNSIIEYPKKNVLETNFWLGDD